METVWEAINQLRVRGAPAIGIAAAYGVCVGVQQALDGDANAVAPLRVAKLPTIWPRAGRRR